MEQKCPQCNQKISSGANICNLCGYDLDQVKNSSVTNPVSADIKGFITKLILKSILGFFISFILITVVILGVMYYVFVKVLPNLDTLNPSDIMANFSVIFVLLFFGIPLLIIIIVIFTIKKSFNNAFNYQFSFKNSLNLVKKFTDIKNIKLKCQDCGNVIDFKSQDNLKKCLSCQSTKFKIDIEK